MQMTLLMPMLVAASATPCAWLPALQAITDTPLQIDTSNYEAMERALRLYNGKPMIDAEDRKRPRLHNGHLPAYNIRAGA